MSAREGSAGIPLRILSAGLAALASLLLLGALLQILLWVPAQRRVFLDMGVELPRWTQFVLSLAQAVRGGWFLALPPFVLLVGLLVAKEFLLRHSAINLALNAAVIVLAGVWCLSVVAAMMLPMMSLLESM